MDVEEGKKGKEGKGKGKGEGEGEEEDEGVLEVKATESLVRVGCERVRYTLVCGFRFLSCLGVSSFFVVFFIFFVVGFWSLDWLCAIVFWVFALSCEFDECIEA